jgi:hypothetical protein
MTGDNPSHQETIKIEGTLQVESASIEARLKAVEGKLEKGVRSSAFTWILDVLKTLLPSIVLAILGFALKDSVDRALREREIQLAAVKEMETLVPDLQKTDLSEPDAQAKAAQLAAYGRYSVPFFVNILEIGNQYANAGSEDGLRMVARSEPDAVCAALQTVIQNRAGLYHWQTHLAGLKILGQASCTKACRDVARFHDTMSNVNSYRSWVSLAPNQSEYDRVFNQAANTLAQLNSLNSADCK